MTKVYPFHISLEGMESVLLCRDDEDFDVMQKYFHVCSWVNNTIVIIDIEMSNHGHLALLAESMEAAVRTGEAIKKNHSQYLTHKYGESRTLSRSSVKVLYLDSDKYLRNALAYIPRNALDAGCRIEDYRWSSYNAMFSRGHADTHAIPVRALTRRDKESFFHTHADLSRVPWKIGTNGLLLPETACDHKYLEDAFLGDQAFFLRTIGGLNYAEMHERIVEGPRTRHNDATFHITISDIAEKWFAKDIQCLNREQKFRILMHLHRTCNTTPAQLARCLQMKRDEVENAIRMSRHSISAQGNK
ncbi:MAG: hypothetical protein J5640_06475 [Bacteroidales bacterium]|nr:hypothetical protein [Bacteroidales bacterium]